MDDVGTTDDTIDNDELIQAILESQEMFQKEEMKRNAKNIGCECLEL